MRTDVRDEELESLAFSRHLRLVDLTESSITDQAFIPLGKIPRLEWLDLSDNAITGVGLSKAKGFRALKRLVLDRCPIDDSGLSGLSKFPNLEKVRLDETHVTDAGLESLARIATLKTLNVTSQHFNGTNLGVFNGSQNLERILFEVPISPAPANRVPIKAGSTQHHQTVFTDLPKLESVDFWLYPLLDSVEFNGLPSLESVKLFFRGCPHHQPGEPYRKCDFCKQQSKAIVLKSLPNLRSLNLGYVGEIEIVDTPNLADLSLYNGSFYFSNISKLKSLTHLKIQDTQELTLETLRQLGPMPQLRSLVLKFEGLNDDSLEVLKNFPNLQLLEVNSGIINESGIERIGMLKSLKKLKLDYVIVDRMDPLQALSGLQELHIDGGNIGDLHLDGLKELKHFRVDANVRSLKLANLPLLTAIRFYDHYDVDTVSLRNLPALKTFSKPYSEDRQLKSLQLEGLPNLLTLDLEHETKNSNLSDKDFEHLSSFSKLDSLDLSNLAVGPQALDLILKLEKLRELSLTSNPSIESKLESVAAKVRKQYFALEQPADLH